MASTSSSSGGISFAGALAVLFIGLKLGGIIGWPWIWILSPIWISVVLVCLIFIVIVALASIAKQ